MKTNLFLILIFLFLPLQAEEIQEILVAPGDTLWSIANKYLKDPHKWTEIVKYNDLQMSDPTVAIPGQKIKVPVLLIKEEFRNATLIESVPEVRVKGKNEADWREAKAVMTLKYEDSLRTMNGAQARVRFPTKEIIQINENSYVVLKPEKILQEVQLLQGNVRASRAKVITPAGTVVQPKGLKSDYQARIREDKSEVVFVYKGQVDVTAKGKTVTVPEGFGTEIPKTAPPLKPLPLSTFKDYDPADLMPKNPPVGKIDMENGVVNVAPPKITIKDPNQKSSGNAKSVVSERILSQYRLQLAKDETFKAIIMDRTEAIGTPFYIKKTPIPDNIYFMRVAFIDALGNQGDFSQPTQIFKDSRPPVIRNVTPAEGQLFRGEDSFCDVTGVVEGAAMIAVNDEIVFISPTGQFSRMIPLKNGKNPITITARDAHGNETIVKRTVNYGK